MENLLDEAGYRSLTIADHDQIGSAIERFNPSCAILDGARISSEWLEELDGIARRVVDEDLRSTRSGGGYGSNRPDRAGDRRASTGRRSSFVA